jgi:transcriptional regulator with XRE-family HTH domain
MTPDQLRMARALLRMPITRLAELAGVDKMVLVRYEGGRKAQPSSISKIRSALAEQGVVFVGAIEPLIEATVALRYGAKAPDESRDGDGQDE